jgi:hypothetical protein
VIIQNETEEAAARLRGYATNGQFNPAAMERSELPAGFVKRDFPKWIAALGRAVDSAEEEMRLTGGAPAVPPVPAQAPEPAPLPAAPLQMQRAAEIRSSFPGRGSPTRSAL